MASGWCASQPSIWRMHREGIRGGAWKFLSLRGLSRHEERVHAVNCKKGGVTGLLA
jgi:hypothetical protein